jgi:hypothetical protein
MAGISYKVFNNLSRARIHRTLGKSERITDPIRILENTLLDAKKARNEQQIIRLGEQINNLKKKYKVACLEAQWYLANNQKEKGAIVQEQPKDDEAKNKQKDDTTVERVKGIQLQPSGLR